MSELGGKHALVTGGGTGVGAAIALALIEAGASVTITGRRLAPLQEMAAKSGRISAIAADVTDETSVNRLFEEMKQTAGPADIVIANAGAAQSLPFSRMDRASWQAMLDVNLTGVFLTLQAALPDMQARGWGRLISIASTAGLKGYPYVSGYCAAKHGVIGLTRALAMELARSGVTVNAVCPGFTETPMLEQSIDNIMAKTGKSREEARGALAASNPMGRFIHPDEIAQSVLWLCGAHSESVTGQAISISGGEI